MQYRMAVEKNLAWFRNSGVMLPDTGEWGVAERVAVLAGNEAAEKILRSFPAWTLHGDYAVVEQRRSDCCFETALAFLLAHEFYGDPSYRLVAENILDFLYFRSGMLNRFHDRAPGSWHWSHISRGDSFWFDDNGWVAALQILIGRRWPDLDRKYQCVKWGVTLAEQMLAGFDRSFDPAKTEKDFSNGDNCSDPEKQWIGRLTLPHWAMPPLAAFLAADQVKPQAACRDIARRYAEYLLPQLDSYTASELAYILIVMPLAQLAWPDEAVFGELNRRVAASMTARAASTGTGNLPAEHFETPVGPHLVDMIYTANWALLGFVDLARTTGEAGHRTCAVELADLLVKLQDRSPRPPFAGCWRGMYDLKAGDWGGGDRYEGGANSIYTGWTNAPIAIGLMLLEHNLGFADLMKGC